MGEPINLVVAQYITDLFNKNQTDFTELHYLYITNLQKNITLFVRGASFYQNDAGTAV